MAFSSAVASSSPSLASPSLSAFPPLGLAPCTSFTPEAGPPPAGSLPFPEPFAFTFIFTVAERGRTRTLAVVVVPVPALTPALVPAPNAFAFPRGFAFAEIAPLVTDLAIVIGRACVRACTFARGACACVFDFDCNFEPAAGTPTPLALVLLDIPATELSFPLGAG